MGKFQIVVQGGEHDREAFVSRFHSTLVPRLPRGRGARVKLSLSRAALPRWSVIPFAREPLAVLSVWGEDPVLPPEAWIAALGVDPTTVSAYRVVESTPVDYTRHWANRSPTPGVGMLTLFRRRPGIDEATFLRRWHEGHTPLALQIHPLWKYQRNVVQKALLSEIAPWDAIVEEHFRHDRDLLDPRRFFGGALAMVPNMLRVAADVRRFIHLGSLQAHLVDEVWLES